MIRIAKRYDGDNAKLIEFEEEKVYRIVLVFNSPKEGQKDGKTWILYRCFLVDQDENGKLYTTPARFFSSQELHSQIQQKGGKRGSVFDILRQNGRCMATEVKDERAKEIEAVMRREREEEIQRKQMEERKREEEKERKIAETSALYIATDIVTEREKYDLTEENIEQILMLADVLSEKIIKGLDYEKTMELYIEKKKEKIKKLILERCKALDISMEQLATFVQQIFQKPTLTNISELQGLLDFLNEEGIKEAIEKIVTKKQMILPNV